MNKQSRRGFLKTIGFGGAALLTCKAGTADASGQEINNEALGMLYDATICVGCKACMTACKRVNGDFGNLSFEKAPFDKDGIWDAPQDLSGSTRTLIKLYKESDTKWSYVKYSCMHCQKPSCVSVCPVSAMSKDKHTGIIDYNKDTCIGCRYCQVGCSFNIPKFQWEKTVPQIVKCDLCKSTNLKQKGITACAETCPVGAITFGKRKDLLEIAHNRLKENPGKYIQSVYGEHELGGTNHLYLAAVPYNKLGLPILPTAAPAEFSERIQHTIYKGFIAPVALYSTLCFIAIKNQKKQDEISDQKKTADENSANGEEHK